MTIDLHISAESAYELRAKVRDTLLMLDATPATKITGSQDPGEITIHEELPAAEATPTPAKRGRKPKADQPTSVPTPPAPPSPEKGEDLEPPAFLDRRPKDAAEPAKQEAPAAAEPEVTIEAVREAMSKVLAQDAKKMKDLSELLAKFKAADGKPCAKASQVQSADRTAFIAGCEAMLKA